MRIYLVLLFTGLATLLSTGCASHYYRVEAHQVALYLKNPEAAEAALVCSLDGYEPRRATLESGRWVVTVPGDKAFRYFYVIDGAPFVPECRLKENDDFGAKNCIFEPDL